MIIAPYSICIALLRIYYCLHNVITISQSLYFPPHQNIILLIILVLSLRDEWSSALLRAAAHALRYLFLFIFKDEILVFDSGTEIIDTRLVCYSFLPKFNNFPVYSWWIDSNHPLFRVYPPLNSSAFWSGYPN